MKEKDQLTVQEEPGAEQPKAEMENATKKSEEPQNQGFEWPGEESAEELKAEIAELKDKYIRMVAEFDTYRRRMMKEKLELINTAAKDTMTALLPVLDDFDRAKKSADQEDSTEQFSEGVTLVYHKLYSVLRQRGLEPVETHEQPFDPEWHEAVAEIPAPSEEMKGKILDTIAKGYTLGSKIIRYAKVVIGK